MKAIPSSSKGSKKVSAVPTASTASAVSTTNGGGDCKRSVGTKAVRQGDHRPGGTKESQKKLKVGKLLQVHHEDDRDEDEVPESMEAEGEIDESDFLGEDDDDDDDDNSDEDDDEESENENWVSRSLYFLAHKLLRSSTSLAPQDLNKASNALNKCRSVTLELNPPLGKIYRASQTRSQDGKVPPGSNLVTRSLADDRYLLCLCCVELSKIHERRMQYTDAVQELRQALLWFPKSIQGNFRLGFLTKTFASSTEKMEEAEKLLKKAVQCLNLLKKSTAEELAALASEFDEGPQDQQSISASTSTSSSTTPAQTNNSPINADQLADEEKCAGESAIEQLTLLQCQQNRFEEAEVLMRQENFTWRLGKQVCLCFHDLNRALCIMFCAQYAAGYCIRATVACKHFSASARAALIFTSVQLCRWRALCKSAAALASCISSRLSVLERARLRCYRVEFESESGLLLLHLPLSRTIIPTLQCGSYY
jgi:hypothetical protein